MKKRTPRSAHLRVALFATRVAWPVAVAGQTIDAPLELVLAAGRPVEAALDHRVTARAPRHHDGNDNESAVSLERIARAAEQRDTVICAIGLFSHEDPGTAKRARQANDTLAERTGGVSYAAAGADDVGAIAVDIADQIRHQYTLGYTPRNRQAGVRHGQRDDDVRGAGQDESRQEGHHGAGCRRPRDQEVAGTHAALHVISLGVAFKALRRNLMRSILASLGVIVGVGAVICTIAIGEGASFKIREAIASIGVAGGRGVSIGAVFARALAARSRLTLADMRAIKDHVALITHVSPVVDIRTQLIYGNQN